MTVSLCMIVKNEEDVLARCLDSVEGIFDEIIIVDTGSTDQTREIASEYTTNVLSFLWIDDFAAARNYAFSKATMDYCMWLDADDVIEEKDRIELLNMKDSLRDDTDMVMMKYNTLFDESDDVTFFYYRERLIRNYKGFRWVGAVHEVIPPFGNVIYSNIAICHRKVREGDPDRNLKIYEKLIRSKNGLDTRQKYYYGRELYYHNRYEEAVSILLGFLDMPDGWIENKIEACLLCADCYRKRNEELRVLPILFRSLEYDVPRAEICCEIGTYLLEHKNYEMAIYWYKTALNTKINDTGGGFTSPDCYHYIPLMQLCVCYDRLGNWEKAKEYNEKAGKCKPNSKAYLYNKAYFHNGGEQREYAGPE